MLKDCFDHLRCETGALLEYPLAVDGVVPHLPGFFLRRCSGAIGDGLGQQYVADVLEERGRPQAVELLQAIAHPLAHEDGDAATLTGWTYGYSSAKERPVALMSPRGSGKGHRIIAPGCRPSW